MRAQATSSILILGAILAACGPAVAPAPAGTPMQSVGAQAELREEMRRLWADHVIWTRQYIVAAVADDPSAGVALERLMRNQQDIGAAIVPFYGAGAGAELTRLLEEHIEIAGEVLAAARANDQAGLTASDRRWHVNAGEIATFLSSANPHWPRADLVHMLEEHLALTTQQAVARLQGDWERDASLFDRVHDQAIEMADALSDGIQRQFAGR